MNKHDYSEKMGFLLSWKVKVYGAIAQLGERVLASMRSSVRSRLAPPTLYLIRNNASNYLANAIRQLITSTLLYLIALMRIG